MATLYDVKTAGHHQKNSHQQMNRLIQDDLIEKQWRGRQEGVGNASKQAPVSSAALESLHL